MLFSLTTSGHVYEAEAKTKLEALGFTFAEGGTAVRKVYYKRGKPQIEIGSLEELMAFVAQWETVILSDGVIEIYDDYRE